MLGGEVAVDQRRREIHQGLRALEESPCVRAQVPLEARKHEPFELRALLAIGPDPVETLDGKSRRVDRMKRLQECTDAVGVLVHERLAADQAIADEERVARDVLETGNVHRQNRSEQRQQNDLEPERLLDAYAPRKPEYPVIVDDRYLEVVAVVDLQNPPRALPKCVRDQAVAIGNHPLIVSESC